MQQGGAAGVNSAADVTLEAAHKKAKSGINSHRQQATLPHHAARRPYGPSAGMRPLARGVVGQRCLLTVAVDASLGFLVGSLERPIGS